MTADLSSYQRRSAPSVTSRLVPSRFPPISVFASVASPEDLEAVFELEGWTNDRMVANRLAQLPREDWVYGRANASVVMAAFLHGSPGGTRFATETLGAWYAATDVATSVLEVANGLRAEMSLTDLERKTETYREYQARLDGDFADIFGLHPEFHQPGTETYPTTQKFGEVVRREGLDSGLSGIRYQSVRHPGHEAWVSYRPKAIEDVTQARHFEIDVPMTGKVAVRRLG